VKVLAEDASAVVDDVHTNALKIYTDIYSLTIPEINIPKLKEVAEFTAQEVGSLVNVAVFTTQASLCKCCCLVGCKAV
jgi:hypothetical protein